MRLLHRLVPGSWLRLPRRTVRLRLTLVYAALFLASGAVLLAITYGLVRGAPGEVVAVSVRSVNGANTVRVSASGTVLRLPPGLGVPPGIANQRFAYRPKDAVLGGSSALPKPLTLRQAEAQARQFKDVATLQHQKELDQLLLNSGIALGLMAAVSIVLGWLAAGRVLRPLRTLNERAREISATSLHKRLALAGPDDELTQLATTFDDLLGRLESSFETQRQFVANASHELRSPLARARTIGEVALADPDATVESLRESHRRVLAAGEQQERLIEALLTLARSERGLAERGPVDLAAVASAAIAARRAEAEERGVAVDAELEPVEVAGDAALVERLVANLVDNAVRHNVPNGRVEVRLTSRNGVAVLSVANSGPPVPPEEVERLFQPFERLGVARTSHGSGVGLGLSIVQAIADAHGARVRARPRAEGGLDVSVAFPRAGGPAEEGSSDAPPEAGASPRVRRRRRRQPRLG